MKAKEMPNEKCPMIFYISCLLRSWIKFCIIDWSASSLGSVIDDAQFQFEFSVSVLGEESNLFTN